MPTPGFFVSSDTKRRLVFTRPQFTMDGGELLPNFESGSQLAVSCFVLEAAERLLALKDLAVLYISSFDVIINGHHDIQKDDRTYIDGHVGHVISASQHPGHLELIVGLLPNREPGKRPE